ncbi:MAG: hypothetical protein JRE65_07640 [Deltaproteobacteria bacterium]|nr:hypothetical protein [Deltaproteobacteria bacterium]
MFSLTRSNLLRQLPDPNEIIRRITSNRDGYSFNRNIFLATAIIRQKGRLLESNKKIFNMIFRGDVITILRKRRVSKGLSVEEEKGGAF